MPILNPKVTERLATGQPATYDPVPFTYRPSVGEAFRTGLDESPFGAFARWVGDKFDPVNASPVEDPNYDPFVGMEDSPYAEYANDFINVRSPADAERVRRRIDRERYRQEQMSSVSFFSLPGLARFTGNITGDPTLLLPFGEAAESASLGRGLLTSAARTSAAAAGAAAIDEATLQSFEETRTPRQSLTNIGISATLGAGLGPLGTLFRHGAASVSDRAATRMGALETALDTYGGGGSLSSAATQSTTAEQEAMKSAFGLENILTPTSPLMRAAASPSVVTRRTMQQLAEDALLRNKNAEGIASEVSVTRRILMRRADLAEGMTALDNAFTDYRLGRAARLGDSAIIGAADLAGRTDGKLTRRQFAQEVGRAMIRGDEHEIPEVAAAARALRATVFDPLKEEAIANGLLPPGVQSKVADTYLMRLYDREKIAAQRKTWTDADGNTHDGFEDRIVRWLEGRQQSMASELEVAQSNVRAASSRLKQLTDQEFTARELGTMTSAEEVATREAREKAQATLNDAHDYHEEVRALGDMAPEELRAIAQEVTDKILHSPRGLNYDAVPLRRGPLKRLTLTIPTNQIEDFLDTNAERVARVYHRVMSTDVELTRMFGRADMEEPMAKIRDDYARLRQGVTDPKELAKLDKQLAADIRDISAVRDRIRGTYGMPEDVNGLLYRAVRTTKTINFLRMLGGMTVSSLPDSMRPVFVHGPLRVVRDALVPMITNLKGYKLAAKEVKLSGAALEMALDGRAMQIGDLADEYARHSRFERGLDFVAGRFGLLSLMDQWTVFWKQFSGIISQTRSLEAAAAWRAGTAPRKEIERLANMGIDQDMAGRIADQFAAHGEDQGTLKWANTQAWSDQEAASHFRAMIGKEVDKIIVTPGQEKPLWMSSQLGQALGQFQSYNIASMQRVLLSGLQQRDASALGGFLGMTMAGMLVYWLQAHLRPDGANYLSDDPRQWVLEGADRGGAFGYAFSADRVLDIYSGGEFSARASMGTPALSRYRQREGLVGMLGPTVGGAIDLSLVTAAAAQDNWDDKSIKEARRLIPLNNVFYWRWVFDEAEQGLDEHPELLTWPRDPNAPP